MPLGLIVSWYCSCLLHCFLQERSGGTNSWFGVTTHIKYGVHLGFWFTYHPPCWSCMCGNYWFLPLRHWVHGTAGDGQHPDSVISPAHRKLTHRMTSHPQGRLCILPRCLSKLFLPDVKDIAGQCPLLSPMGSDFMLTTFSAVPDERGCFCGNRPVLTLSACHHPLFGKSVVPTEGDPFLGRRWLPPKEFRTQGKIISHLCREISNSKLNVTKKEFYPLLLCVCVLGNTGVFSPSPRGKQSTTFERTDGSRSSPGMQRWDGVQEQSNNLKNDVE